MLHKFLQNRFKVIQFFPAMTQFSKHDYAW